MSRAIEISPSIIFRTLLILGAIWFLYVIRDVIALFLISVIITAALTPIIKRMQRIMPRQVSVTLVYIIFFCAVGLLIYFILPVLTAQMEELSKALPGQIHWLQEKLGMEQAGTAESTLANLGAQMAGSLQDIVSTTAGVFAGMISAVAVIAMSFYMSLTKDGLKRFLTSITPQRHKDYVSSLTDRIEGNFGRWVVGQIITMLFVGTLYYIALTVLGVPYALVLAVLGGLLEIVPYFGPIMSAVPAAILGFMIDPLTGILVIVAYLLINMLENYVLIPKIMNRAIGLNPVAVILALLIGLQVAGIVGVILAVPIAGAIGIFARDMMDKKTAQAQ